MGVFAEQLDNWKYIRTSVLAAAKAGILCASGDLKDRVVKNSFLFLIAVQQFYQMARAIVNQLSILTESTTRSSSIILNTLPG